VHSDLRRGTLPSTRLSPETGEDAVRKRTVSCSSFFAIDTLLVIPAPWTHPDAMIEFLMVRGVEPAWSVKRSANVVPADLAGLFAPRQLADRSDDDGARVAGRQ